jgi:hypothetical protein
LSQTVLTSLGTGFGFLPVIALASLAAPRGAEAAAFALVISAQTAGTLVAAAGAAGLSVAMGVGAAGHTAKNLTDPVAHGSGREAVVLLVQTVRSALHPGTETLAVGDQIRSWERLPDFILVCACSKLLALLLALPLLIWLQPRLRQAQLRSLIPTAEAQGVVHGAAVAGRSVGDGELPRMGEGMHAPLLDNT